eukprot:1159885-Pelagomonas_calceolata.AAC.4
MGRVSSLLRPTRPVRTQPSGLHTTTCCPLRSSHRYAVRSTVLATYWCTAPAQHAPHTSDFTRVGRYCNLSCP